MMRLAVALAAVLLGIPMAARAVTLSGIMVYATDHYGNPHAWDAEKDDFKLGQLWRTRLGGDWFGLGVLAGVPPGNSDAPLLNAADFSIATLLSPGENDFTMLGEPGPSTRDEEYTHLAVNLYFDGVLDHPAISVLVSRNAARDGDAPLLNPAPTMYALSLVPVQQYADMTYTDGLDTVSVIALSFLPPEKFGVDYDKVSAHATVPSTVNPGPNGPGADGLGGLDYIGVLKIDVEGLGGSAPMGVPAPAAVGNGPHVSPDLGGYNLGGYNPGYGGPVPGEQLGAGGVRPAGGSSDSGSPMAQAQMATGNTATASAEATAAAAETPTPVGTVAVEETTPTPRSTAQASRSRTAAPKATSTSAAVDASPTPTLSASSTGASAPADAMTGKPRVTPTPGAPKPQETKG